MNDFLTNMGWKMYNGKMDKKEVAIDLGVFSLIVGVVWFIVGCLVGV